MESSQLDNHLTVVPTTFLIWINVLEFQLLREKSFFPPIIHEVNMHIIMSLSIQETPIGPCNHMLQQKLKRLFSIFLIGPYLGTLCLWSKHPPLHHPLETHDDLWQMSRKYWSWRGVGTFSISMLVLYTRINRFMPTNSHQIDNQPFENCLFLISIKKLIIE